MSLGRVRFVDYLNRHESPTRLKQWAKIKVRHLMSHQAGISKDTPGALAFFNTESLATNSYPSLTDFDRGLTSVEFLFEPGQITTGLKYSNLGMNLLARIVEDMNPQGLTYAEYLSTNILAPLGMNSTFINVPLPQQNEMVQGFGNLLPDATRTQVPKAYSAGAYEGSIGIATTATDLAKLGSELLRLSQNNSVLLLHKNQIEKLLTIESPAAPTTGWAQGPTWQVLPGETTKNPIWLGHTGTGASERAILIAAPEKNLGIVLLFNVADANREKYAKIISDLIPQSGNLSPFGKKIIQKAKAKLDQTPAPATIVPPAHSDTTELEKYVGTYFADIPGYQKITLAETGHLVFFGQKLVVEDVKRGLFRFPPIPGPAGALFNREPLVFSFDDLGKPIGFRVAHVKKFVKNE